MKCYNTRWQPIRHTLYIEVSIFPSYIVDAATDLAERGISSRFEGTTTRPLPHASALKTKRPIKMDIFQKLTEP